MRKSRVLLAGVAVAAAAVATSAFTASNTVPNSVAGYGQGVVTGATVDTIHYNANAADGTILDSVDFVLSTNVTGRTVTMTLKNGVTDPVAPDTVFRTPYTCVSNPAQVAWVGDGGDPELGTMTVRCLTPADGDGPVHFEDFDAVGLTVLQ